MRLSDVNLDNYTDYMRLFEQFSKNKGVKKSMFPMTNGVGAKNKNSKQTSDIPEGMDITGRSDWKKIIHVSDEIKGKVHDLMKKEFVDNYGMSDGEAFRALQKEYVMSLPPSDRASAIWTLDQMWGEEGKRLSDIVKSEIPGWQNGQSFDRNAVGELFAKSDGIDVKI